MAGSHKYGQNLSIDEVAELRVDIEEKISNIAEATRLQIGEFLELVHEIGPHFITPHQVRHLRNLHIIQPEEDNSGDRKVYWYTKANLRDLLIILNLENKYQMPLSKAGALLFAEARQRHASLGCTVQQSAVVVPQNQTKRAQFHLRGRLLEVLLTWLFDDQMPYRAIFLLRQKRYLHRTNGKINSKIINNGDEWHRVEKILDQRPDDLVVKVSASGEILHCQEVVNWKIYRHYRWWHLVLQGNAPNADYTLVIGVPPDTDIELSPEANTQKAAETLTPILQLCFLPQWKNGSDSAETPLEAMANMIPDITACWQYCAIFISDRTSGEETLRVLAHSTYFPRDLNTGTLVLSPGQLLSGWTYQTGQVCIVQNSIGPDDPRIARQSEEQAGAGIAVPTLGDTVNGVIYVGTRTTSKDHNPFPPERVKTLRLLGSAVGEFIQRQHITQKTRRTCLNILAEKPLNQKPWQELNQHLEDIINRMWTKTDQYNHLDNLHIMAVRLNNYEEIQARSKQIARWIADLVIETTGHFYYQRYSIPPTALAHSSSEFVMVVCHLRFNNAQEKQLRHDLREQLGTLVLPFDHGMHPIEVEWLVWSLSFRFKDLFPKLEQSGTQAVAETLCYEVSDALANLPLIYEAHLYESQGAFHSAYDCYHLAHRRAPHNTYLMRHLAKIRTRMGDYTAAVGWWSRVLSHEQHARYYQHLAEVYALLQDYPAALRHYEIGTELDPQDDRCFLGWGQLLLAMNDYEGAVEKFMTARSLNEANKVPYMLRVAEAYAGMGNYDEAVDICERVLIWDRENSEAVKFLLQFLPKRKAPAGFSTDRIKE